MKFFVNNYDFFQEGMGASKWERFNFHKHKNFTQIKDDATIIIDKILSIEDLDELNKKLLSMKKSIYYFICFRLNLDENKEKLKLPIFSNPQIFFFAFDLRDHILTDDNIKPLNGVTIPSPYKFFSPKNYSKNNNKYYFSFKGNCNQAGYFGCCQVRKYMKNICKSNNSNYNYLYEDTSEKNINKDKNLYMHILENSKFGLVLHGDARWSKRFMEVMGSGAIPVLIADGLTLPFEEIINYDNSIIRISEKQLYSCKSVNDFIKLLPNENDSKIYDNKAKNIYEKYFSNDNFVLNNLIKCMEIKINKHIASSKSRNEDIMEGFIGNSLSLYGHKDISSKRKILFILATIIIISTIFIILLLLYA